MKMVFTMHILYIIEVSIFNDLDIISYIKYAKETIQTICNMVFDYTDKNIEHQQNAQLHNNMYLKQKYRTIRTYSGKYVFCTCNVVMIASKFKTPNNILYN